MSLNATTTKQFKNALQGVNTEGLRLRLIDAKGEVVGRLAARIALVLQGKDKPTYAPNVDGGDVVVVVNARHVELTGRKWEGKLYRWHTGFPGGLKQRTAGEQHERDPTKVLYNAVYGMLPKNNMRKLQSRKLRIFADGEHPFAGHPGLQEWRLAERNIRIKGEPFVPPEGFEPANPAAWQRHHGRPLEQMARREAERRDRDARLAAVRRWQQENGEPLT